MDRAGRPRAMRPSRHGAFGPNRRRTTAHRSADLSSSRSPTRNRSWAALPYANQLSHSPGDFTPAVVDRVVGQCLEHQLKHGASAVIAPYLHLDPTHGGGWVQLQLALWRATRDHLDRAGLTVDVIGLLALDWKLLGRASWPAAVHPLQAGLADLGVTEIALAASKVDQGVRPDHRLIDLVATIRRLRRTAPVTAWQQGTLGEAAIAAGAAGYETGIGRRERCDLRGQMSQHRTDSGPGPRLQGIYIPQLGRSVTKRNLEILLDDRRIGPHLVCIDPGCCPAGRDSLLGDARAHTIAQRARRVDEMQRIDIVGWQWNYLADHSAGALELAERANAVLSRAGAKGAVNIGALTAINRVANTRRQSLSRQRAAA